MNNTPNPAEQEATIALHTLPEAAAELLQSVQLHPFLLAHLILVHDVAARLVEAIQARWPAVALNAEAIRFGAATHDIGKVVFPEEILAPGEAHREAGRTLLLELGIGPERARFTATHVPERALNGELEDILVALADVLWKGGRHEPLETALLERLTATDAEEAWETFMALDDLLTQLSGEADKRLLWQAQFLPVQQASD
ncbi:MAG: HD domain-containing protein [Candidatus Promineifilaceae bacterium]|nr:HD domain-containing protein [Candidatus Promineifilaceae bacterium]